MGKKVFDKIIKAVAERYNKQKGLVYNYARSVIAASSLEQDGKRWLLKNENDEKLLSKMLEMHYSEGLSSHAILNLLNLAPDGKIHGYEAEVNSVYTRLQAKVRKFTIRSFFGYSALALTFAQTSPSRVVYSKEEKEILEQIAYVHFSQNLSFKDTVKKLGINYHGNVRCPICGKLDNYTPARYNLCLDCFCKELNTRMDKGIKFAEATKSIKEKYQ